VGRVEARDIREALAWIDKNRANLHLRWRSLNP
jgi:hypothetical protein